MLAVTHHPGDLNTTMSANTTTTKMETRTILNILTPRSPMMIRPMYKATIITILSSLTEYPYTMTQQADSQLTKTETKCISITGLLQLKLLKLIPGITKGITMFTLLTSTMTKTMKSLPQSRLPILLLTTMIMI